MNLIPCILFVSTAVLDVRGAGVASHHPGNQTAVDKKNARGDKRDITSHMHGFLSCFAERTFHVRRACNIDTAVLRWRLQVYIIDVCVHLALDRKIRGRFVG